MSAESQFPSQQPTNASDSQPRLIPHSPRTIESEDILQGEDEVQILHLDKVYRLRKTRNGKLILQK